MRRLPALALLAFLTGCSNAPIAGFLDTVVPARGGGRDTPRDTGPAPTVPDVRPPGSGGGSLPPPPGSGGLPQPELGTPQK